MEHDIEFERSWKYWLRGKNVPSHGQVPCVSVVHHTAHIRESIGIHDGISRRIVVEAARTRPALLPSVVETLIVVSLNQTHLVVI